MKALTYNEALELRKKVMTPPCIGSEMKSYRKKIEKGIIPSGNFWYLNEFTYNMWLNRNSNNPINTGEVTYKSMFETFNYLVNENERAKDMATYASYPSDGNLY